MFCPTCGAQNPDGFRYCNVCGKDPKTAIQPTTTAKSKEEPRVESHTLRNLAIGVIVVVIGLVVLNNLRTSGAPGISTREALTPESFQVGPGQIQYFTFTLSGSGRVTGRFEATGGTGNDIEAAIMTADEFENWKNGHQARVFYQSGKVTVGTVNTVLAPGTYILAFNNRFSMLTAKNISSTLVVNH
jgi:hypothetical protein